MGSKFFFGFLSIGLITFRKGLDSIGLGKVIGATMFVGTPGTTGTKAKVEEGSDILKKGPED
jgi:hypothetical protein